MRCPSAHLSIDSRRLGGGGGPWWVGGHSSAEFRPSLSPRSTWGHRGQGNVTSSVHKMHGRIYGTDMRGRVQEGGVDFGFHVDWM